MYASRPPWLVKGTRVGGRLLSLNCRPARDIQNPNWTWCPGCPTVGRGALVSVQILDPCCGGHHLQDRRGNGLVRTAVNLGQPAAPRASTAGEDRDETPFGPVFASGGAGTEWGCLFTFPKLSVLEKFNCKKTFSTSFLLWSVDAPCIHLGRSASAHRLASLVDVVRSRSCRCASLARHFSPILPSSSGETFEEQGAVHARDRSLEPVLETKLASERRLRRF